MIEEDENGAGALDADLAQLDLLAEAPPVHARGGPPLSESFASAMRSLRANKQRAVLTMLGIIIGVSSVILILSIGSGLAGYTREGFEKGPASSVIIQGADQRTNGIETGKRIPSLTVDDAEVLNQPGVIPDAVTVAAVKRGEGQIRYRAANAAVTVIGTWATYPAMNDYAVTKGEFFTEGDVAATAPVVALGPNVARKLFDDRDPIGESVFLNNKAVQVIGVMEVKGAGGLDDSVYLPLSTYLNRVLGAPTTANGLKTVDQIAVKATALETVPIVEAQVQQFLDARHTPIDGARDFATSTSLATAMMVLRIISVINAGLIAVSCIALIVGGVGITNIMLVSVTERTREIGIRKAIGAREKDILAQFVIEAILISLVGAAIALVIGGFFVLLVNLFWRPAPVAPLGVLAALAAAVVTGLTFGISPARKAARLEPIIALRTE